MNPDDLLLPFEKTFPNPYREYYAIKRNNFFAGVTQIPELWACFMRLDEVFAAELDDLHLVSDPYETLPLMLFSHAHAQFRIFMELGFTGVLPEAFNIARIAIESAFQARKILTEPSLHSVWLRADRSKAQNDEFEEKFNSYKADKFAALGLQELYKYWKRFSLWSHSGVASLNQRFKPTGVMYFEADLQAKVLMVFDLLWVSHKIENALFEGHESRLKLDVHLEKKRKAFRDAADKARLALIEKFNIQAPKTLPKYPYS